MSGKNIKAQMLVDLLIEQQQVLVGGQQSGSTNVVGSTPSALGIGSPNATGGPAFGNSVLGEGFPNVSGGGSVGGNVLGTGYPKVTNGGTFGSSVLGEGFPNVTSGNSAGNAVQTSNSNQNSSGVIAY